MEVTVRTLNNASKVVKGSMKITVSQLREFILAQFEVPIAGQVWAHNGRVIPHTVRGSVFLTDLGVSNGDTIVVVFSKKQFCSRKRPVEEATEVPTSPPVKRIRLALPNVDSKSIDDLVGKALERLESLELDEGKLELLESMGFSRNACRRALLLNRGVLQSASEYLVEFSDDPAINEPKLTKQEVLTRYLGRNS